MRHRAGAALTPAVLRCSGAPAAQQAMGAKPRRRTNADLDELQHPLLGDQPTLQLMTPKDATGARLSLGHASARALL